MFLSDFHLFSSDSAIKNFIRIHPTTGCLKIGEFRIQSVVGDHFSRPNMEIKKNRNSPHKDTLV
jgi:hypothetical protein